MSREPSHPIVAVYPGSFDPLTLGHLDIIRRAARLFNQLVVGVGRNPDKKQLFTPREREAMLAPHVARFPNVRVASYDGLTIDFVRAQSGRVLVRGIRDIADLSSEMQQAAVNLAIGGIETAFLMASERHVLTSSTFVKQIYEMSHDLSRIRQLVPENVATKMAERLGRPAPRKTRKARK